MSNNTTAAPVYQYSDSEAYAIRAALALQVDAWASEEERKDALASIPACVLVGRFDNYTTGSYHGADVLSYGTPVTAYASGGAVVYHTFVSAAHHWESETVNKIGGLGASRDIPNEQGIAGAIEEARQHL